MRILHFIPSIDPASGGPAEGLKQFCQIFAMGGHEVEVATLDSPQLVEKVNFPAKVYGLGPGHGIYRYTPRAVPWFKANVSNYDLVNINCIWQFNALAAYRALAGSSIPYAVFTHGMLDPYFKRRFPFKHLKKTIYWHLFLKKMLCQASTVFFTAEDERILARESFGGYRVRESVIPYGTFGPNCDTAAAAEEFLVMRPRLRGKRIALSLGRINYKKGTDLLIQSFAGTLAKDSAWHLVIAGPDELGWKVKLQALAASLGIADRIDWPGMLKGKDKWGAFQAAELFVLPSHQENFGIAVAESLSCGTPVLLSDRVNIWREVEKHGAGFVGADTLEGTSASMRRWSALTAQQIAATRARARKCFDEQFNFEATSKKVLEMIEEVARTGRRAAPSLPSQPVELCQTGESKIEPARQRRILLLQGRGYGDAVIGTALIDSLKTGLPSARIDVLIREEMRSIFENNPNVNNLYIGCFPMGYRKDFTLVGILRLLSTILVLRKQGYTDVVNLMGDFREEVLARLISSRDNWSPSWSEDHPCRRTTRRAALRTANRPVPIDASHPNVYDYLNIVGAAMGGARNGKPALYNSAKQKIVWDPIPRSIGIHPAAGHVSRMWDLKQWREAAGRLVEGGMDVLVVGARADSDRLRAAFNAIEGPQLQIVAGDFPAFFDALSRMRILLCHDSFAAHAGFAIGVPIVFLNGGNDARAWAPPGATVLSAGADLACYPCYNHPTCAGRPHEFDCIRRIGRDSVLQAVWEAVPAAAKPREARTAVDL